MTFTYVAFDSETNRIKIGKSSRPRLRISRLRGRFPQLELLGTTRLSEKRLHTRFAHLRCILPDDDAAGTREWFRAEKELLEFIVRPLGKHRVAPCYPMASLPSLDDRWEFKGITFLRELNVRAIREFVKTGKIALIHDNNKRLVVVMSAE